MWQYWQAALKQAPRLKRLQIFIAGLPLASFGRRRGCGAALAGAGGAFGGLASDFRVLPVA
eukprot:738706-Heterocapsa_arctica.AAC.1